MNDSQQPITPTPQQNTGKKSASLALGVIALVISAIGFFTVILSFLGFIALPMAIVAVILAVQSNKIGVPASGGLVTGIIALVFSGISVACWIACVAIAGWDGWEDLPELAHIITLL